MQIQIFETSAPRIYTVVLDFSGYLPSKHRQRFKFIDDFQDIDKDTLDEIIGDLKLRRIKHWGRDNCITRGKWRIRYLTYYTTVISDREL